MISKIKFSALALLSIAQSAFSAESLGEAFNNASMTGTMRLGSVQHQNATSEKTSTVALGGYLNMMTDSIAGISLGTTFYTTNALLGKNEEGMFLGSDKQSYSILGEAYLQAELGNSLVKVGRQIIQTPFADSDDIGMIPNTFQGYTLINQDIPDATVIVAKLDRWSGVDSERPERFIKLGDKGVLMAGTVYEGFQNTTLQAWHYQLDEMDLDYLEADYESEYFNVGVQYTDQDNKNRTWGLTAGMEIGDLALHSAYNKVEGIVANGFGGGPFFTSGEDHTIADTPDQEAVLIGAAYKIGDITLASTHVDFDKGANETDYIASYAINTALSFDLIHSDLYEDGKLTRFFVNYNL